MQAFLRTCFQFNGLKIPRSTVAGAHVEAVFDLSETPKLSSTVAVAFVLFPPAVSKNSVDSHPHQYLVSSVL